MKLAYLLVLALVAVLSGCNEQDVADKPVAAVTSEADVQEQMSAQDALAESAQTVAGNGELRVLDISSEQYAGRPAIVVVLSAPADADKPVSDWLAVDDAKGKRVNGSWVVSENAKRLYFTAVEPQQTYRVQVTAGLPGQHTELSQGSTAKVEIAAVATLLGFAGNGNLLAKDLARGLPVIAANVERADVDFYRVPESMLVSFLSDNSRRGQLDFWRLRDRLTDFELVYSGRFDLQLAPNQQATRYLPVKDINSLTASGVYVAVMREAGDYRYEYPATWFAVSDLGLHLRRYPQQLDVTVNSLKTATPVSKVQLRLLDSSGRELASQLSSQAGTASFTDELDDAALLIATTGNGDTSLVRLFGAGLDLAEFPVSGPATRAEQLFLYSPRDLYRPGEEVLISGLLRDADGKAVPVLANQDGSARQRTAQLSLTRPDGQEVASQTLSLDQLGYLQSAWQLPADAATGEWRLLAEVNADDVFSYAFQVEEFLPERMQLSLDSDEYLQAAQPWKIKVQGEYLYGAPAKGNLLENELLAKQAEHPFSAWPDTYFGHPNVTGYDRRIYLDSLTLNEQGEAVLVPPAFWQQTTVPLQLKVFHSLIDSGGRPVSRRSLTHVLPASELVGIRPLFANDTVDYDSTASFEIMRTDGINRLAAENLKAELIREYRQYHWVYSESNGWQADYTQREYPVFSSRVDIIADSNARVSMPVEWGYYRLEVTDPASGLMTGYRFQAGWDPGETTMAGRPDRIGLALNQQLYAADDEVTVAIKPPAAGKGFLLVESDQPLLRIPVDIPGQGAEVSFTLDPAWQRHDLYVSVLLIQPGETREQALPRRMLGITPLPLDRENRRLNIEIGTAAEAYPNSTLQIPLQVDSDDLPDEVRVTLAAVDVGVLNISRFATPDPFAEFFAQRAYQVNNRDSYGNLIEADAGELAILKYGGDEDFNGANETGDDVQIVSLFTGPVNLDADGKGTVELQLPDFNGRLRLMAVAFSADKFGSAEQDINVAAPLVTQLTRPRFLAPGDHSQLALDLHNLSGTAQTLNVEMLLNGLRTGERGDTFADDAYQQSLTLQHAEKRTLYIPVQAAEFSGAAQISLNIDGLTAVPADQQQIRRHWQLTVRPAWASQSLLQQLRLAPGESRRLASAAQQSWISDSLQGQLRISSLPPVDFTSHFDALQAYPYGCLEQTTSGVFPQLFVTQALISRFNMPESTVQSRQQALQLAVSRLLGMQLYSGGFGLWSNDSPEEHWLTVYVTDFLLRARAAGYPVPQAGFERALQRVEEYLRSPSQLEYLPARSRFAVRAYAAQILARAERASLADLRSLYDYERGNGSFMPLIQLGLALHNSGDSKRGERALTAGLAAASSDYQYVDYGSRLRDTALAIFWLLEAGRSAEYWQPLLDQLQASLGQRRWLSTQERNALFLAGQALVAEGEQPLDLTLNMAQQTDQLQQVDGYNLGLQGQQAAAPLQITNHSSVDAYVNLRIQGRTADAPVPQSNRLRVARRYYNGAGELLKNQQNIQLTSGEQLIVELLIEAADNRPHALLVDLLPAGLELENQNLNDAYAISDMQINGESLVQRLNGVTVNHQEYRDDRFVAAVPLYAEQPVRLYYLARAVSAGEFRMPPSFAEDMYQPEIRHQGNEAGRLVVRSR